MVGKNLKEFFKRLKKHNTEGYTAECAYYIILSFIPFLIILLTLIQYTNISQETLFETIKLFTPNIMNEGIHNIIQEIYSKSLGTISISAIVAIWSAGRGFYALCRGLNEAYDIQKKQTYWYLKIKGIICTLIFIVFIVLSLALVVFGNNVMEMLKQRNTNVSILLTNIMNLRRIGLMAVLFILFLLMYKYVPAKKRKFKNQIWGALFSAISWSAISSIFGMYVNIFRGFSVMYGSLTNIILIMMWMYASMYILLMGAEINSMVEKANTQQLNSKN